MTQGALLEALIMGSLRDPILWVIGAAIGWDFRRDVIKSVTWMILAGIVWGVVRSIVYRSFGESMNTSLVATLVLVCAALMVAVGLATRAVRRMFVER